jgi:hypothetical protein
MTPERSRELLTVFRLRVGAVVRDLYEHIADDVANQDEAETLHDRVTVDVILLAALMHMEFRGYEPQDFMALARLAWQAGRDEDQGSKLQ